MRRGLACAVVLSLARLLLSCRGETTVLMTVKGTFADVRALHVIVVREDGPDTMTYDLPAANDKPLALPGTVLLRSSDDAQLLGVFVWATDANNRIIAAARSVACFKVEAHAQAKVEITLEAPPIGWRPDDSRNCACKPSSPGADMCMQSAGLDAGVTDAGTAGGKGGLGSGGAGGSPTGTGGGAGSPGTGGSGAGGAGMGGAGTGGTAPPAAAGVLWGFEEANGWSPTGATVALDMAMKKQGTASLLVTPSTPMVQLLSRAFMPAEVGAATAKIGIDVYVTAPPPDGLFVALWMECKSAALYGYFVDNFSLKGKGVQANMWSRLTWPIKPEAVAALGMANDCVARLDFAGLNQMIRIDNMSFEP